jgi:hypothetical protein
MNMLHLAASMGRYIIVKWLVANELLPLEAYCGEGLNACHLAVRGDHVATGLYLLPLLADSVDSDGRSSYWYAHHSTHKDFVDWEHLERRKTDCAYVAELIESRVSSFFLKLYIDMMQFFSGGTDCFSDEYEAPLRCALRCRRYDFLEWAVTFFYQQRPTNMKQSMLRDFMSVCASSYSSHVTPMVEVNLAPEAVEVQSYLDNFISVYLVEGDQESLDQQAVSDRRREFQRLLKEGTPIDHLLAFMNGDLTLLQSRCYRLKLDQEEGNDVDFKGEEYYFDPLTFAARDGTLELFQWILSMLPEGSVNSLTTLNDAAEAGRLDVVTHLIDHMSPGQPLASKLIQPIGGVMLLTAALFACGVAQWDTDASHDFLSRFHPEVVTFLVQKAAAMSQDTNAFVYTRPYGEGQRHDSVLFRAVENLLIRPDLQSCWDLVKWLLDQKGVDINSQNDKDDPIEGSRITLTRRLVSKIQSSQLSEQSEDRNYTTVLKYLFNRGLDLRRDGEWAIQRLCDFYIVFLREPRNSQLYEETMRFLAEDLGVSTQRTKIQLGDPKTFRRLQMEQKGRWRLAATLSQGLPLTTIIAQIEADEQRHALFTAKYEKGRSLLHCAALNDRDDVIDWLVSAHGLDVGAVDGEGVSVFEMARRAGASKAMRAIATIRARVLIPDFCARRYRLRRARREWQGRRAAAVLIQKRVRLHQAYQLCGPFLREKRGSWQRFQGIWRGVIAAIEEALLERAVEASWAEVKADCDIFSSLRFHSDLSAQSANEVASQDPRMQDLMTKAAAPTTDTPGYEGSDASDDDDDPDTSMESSGSSDVMCHTVTLAATQRVHRAVIPTVAPSGTIELSQAVTKWLEKADAKYRQLFCRRMEQLAGGYRSYALSKRLSHCRHPIYESKLDAGQRILWTKLRRGEPHEQRYSILVRFYR